MSLELGRRVRLLRNVERYPHFIADAGLVGVVSHVDDDVLAVRLEEPLAGAEAWDNEVHWYMEADGSVAAVVAAEDLEVLS